MNQVHLQGRFCGDLKKSNKCWLATLAVPVRYPKEETEFIPLLFSEKTGDILNKYCGKGDPLIVTGILKSFKKNEQTQLSVTVTDFDFPMSRPKSKTEDEAEEKTPWD